MNMKNLTFTFSKKYVLMLMMASLLIVSCSPYKITSDYDQNTSFSQYKTFALKVDDLKLNDIDQSRVINEITKQMNAKGFQQSENPDFLINLKASHKRIQDIQQSYPYYGGFGWGGPWGWGFGMNRTWAYEYNQGTLIFDMIDAKTNKLVWQGIGAGINVDSPKSKQKQIPEIIAEILKNYPPVK
jgi:hypothetical protein